MIKKSTGVCSPVAVKKQTGYISFMKRHPVNTFSVHYRQKYSRPVGKIPLDVGLPCPNRLSGGCIYCRPDSFTPSYLDQNDSIAVQINKGKKFLLRDRFRLYFGYFQQETPTAMPQAVLLPLLARALDDEDCVGLIISTRPDELQKNLLEGLAELTGSLGKECILEIGLQTSHARSLKLLNRNHSFEDFIDAVSRVQALPSLKTGVHLILGIPGETEEDMFTTIRQVRDLGIDALKLHHLQVIRDTPLHTLFLREEAAVFTVEEYLELLVRLLPEIPEQVVIHRLWSHSHPDLLIAPRWDIFAADLSAQLKEIMSRRGIYQGKYVE